MAKADSFVRVIPDPIFTQTRMKHCLASDCKYNKLIFSTDGEPQCKLKTIEIGEKGKCAYFKEGELEADYQLGE